MSGIRLFKILKRKLLVLPTIKDAVLNTAESNRRRQLEVKLRFRKNFHTICNYRQLLTDVASHVLEKAYIYK